MAILTQRKVLKKRAQRKAYLKRRNLTANLPKYVQRMLWQKHDKKVRAIIKRLGYSLPPTAPLSRKWGGPQQTEGNWSFVV